MIPSIIPNGIGAKPSGTLRPLFAYAGNDALSFTWQGTSYRSADTRPLSDGAWHHEPDALTTSTEAKQILLGIAGYLISAAGTATDILLLAILDCYSDTPQGDQFMLAFLNGLDSTASAGSSASSPSSSAPWTDPAAVSR